MKNFDEVIKLVKNIVLDNSFAGYRDAATISMILLGCLSSRDIVALKVKDIIEYPGAIIIKLNKRYRKILKLNRVLEDAIMRYIRKIKEVKLTGDCLFYFDVESAELATKKIRMMLKRRCQESRSLSFSPTEIRQIGLVYALKNARTLKEILSLMKNSGYVFVSSVADKFGLEDFEKLDPILSEFSDRIKGK